MLPRTKQEVLESIERLKVSSQRPGPHQQMLLETLQEREAELAAFEPEEANTAVAEAKAAYAAAAREYRLATGRTKSLQRGRPRKA